MESSRRAVEAYWRSRMIDNATSDDEKIAPIYRLDEICETLRSSHISIVKEMSEYILKRLDHKSPLVKQKALRLIKYSVGKAGVEFKREMQRHSGALRQLFHYRGQVDALKGDALNKAVRDTAHEAIAAIFASDEKPAATEEINKRIQGFGNSNFEMPVEDRKSFLSDVVGFGSASIRQGLSTISGNPLAGKGNTNGSYRGPSLRKSLTAEREIFERNGREESSRESQYSFDSSEPRDGSWNHDSRVSTSGKTNGNMGLNQARGSGHEERLLDTITAPGGVRLQPSRETIQSFLLEASKLDAAVLSHALESKLQSHSWQVRLKTICVLESILRQREDRCFETIATFFEENKGTVVTCTESPQTSLREKANRVLDLLQRGSRDEIKTTVIENPKNVGPPVVVEMPDLIDTSETDLLANEGASQEKSNEDINIVTTSVSPIVGDLLGDNLLSYESKGDNLNTEDDPFAGMSIHGAEAVESDSFANLFSVPLVDNSEVGNEVNKSSNDDEISLFSGLTTNVAQIERKPSMHSENLVDLVGNLSVNEPTSDRLQQYVHDGNSSNASGPGLNALHQNHPTPYQTSGSVPSSQVMGLNSSLLFPTGPLQYSFPSNVTLHQAFAPQAMNFGALGNSFAQQQLLATMANWQQFGKGADFRNAGFLHTGYGTDMGFGSSFADGFHFSSDPMQGHASTTENPRKEETRAFDFISWSMGRRLKSELYCN